MDDLRDSCLVDCAQKAITVVYKCLYKYFLGVFSFYAKSFTIFGKASRLGITNSAVWCRCRAEDEYR